MSTPSAIAPPTPLRTTDTLVPPLGDHSTSDPAASGSARPRLRAAFPAHPWLWLAALVIASGWDLAAWTAISGYTMPHLEAIEALTFRHAMSALLSLDANLTLLGAQYVAYQGVKLFGTVWVSAAVAAVIILRSLFQPDTGRVRLALRRGTLMFLCPAAAGLLAEALKLLLRRERPEFATGRYSFRFTDWLSSSGLGLPSSHAAVAVGAAAALAVIAPSRRWLWTLLATLCCLGRALSGAHFLSDVLLGVLVGLTAARLIIVLDLRNNRGIPLPA